MHIPVLKEEIIAQISHKDQLMIDCTIGAGGHTKAILSIFPNIQVYAIDQDKDALELAKNNLSEFKERVCFFHENYSTQLAVMENEKMKADIILADLGVSNMQLDNPNRGFSFMYDAPLDMRMNQEASFSAYDIVNFFSVAEIVQILFQYGEEPQAKNIAQGIINARKNQKIETTKQLAEIINRSIRYKKKSKKNPCTKTFQALRIKVNNELKNLEKMIFLVPNITKSGSRVLFISFHSLEDRIIKYAIQQWLKPCVCPTDMPFCICEKKPLCKKSKTQFITASNAEMQMNPRSRSAKLRYVEML